MFVSRLMHHHALISCFVLRAARFRPPNTLERQSQGVRCIDVDKSSTTVTLLDGQTAGQPFSFDRVFSETATQEEVYRYVAHPLVQEVIEGYNW